MPPLPEFVRVSAAACCAFLVGLIGLIGLVGLTTPAFAALDDSLAALGDFEEWKLRSLTIRGNSRLSDSETAELLLTHARAWYRPWESRKAFDAATFEADVDRLLRAYEDEGFFLADIAGGVRRVDDGPLVDAWFEITEGPRAQVGSVAVGCEPSCELADLVLPVATGDPFSGARYRAGEDVLLRTFLDRGQAHVVVTRRAAVDRARRRVDIVYSVVPGAIVDFDETRIEGLEAVEPELVERSLRYARDEPFSISKLERSRRDLLALGLFSSVRFEVDPDDLDASPVPIQLRLKEKPPREIRAGVGYSTEEAYGAHLAWSHANWLGGGRKLSATARYSAVKWSANVDLAQPFLLGRRHGSGHLRLRVFQEDEDSFVVDAVGGVLGVERHWGEAEQLITGVGFGVTYSDVNGVNPTLAARIGYVRGPPLVGGVRESGRVRDKALAIGPTLALRWDTTNDPFAPARGTRLSFDASQVGAIWGGEYQYYKLEARAARYIDVGHGVVAAGRLQLGVADSINGRENLPVFERFFAGGERSVRGYQRRELGPNIGGDPAGGRSLVEGSLELRRFIGWDVGGVAFIDAGQVSLGAFEFRPSRLKFSAGPGLTYKTPIGPLSLFVGFPFDPLPGEAAWQIHFSIGHFF